MATIIACQLLYCFHDIMYHIWQNFRVGKLSRLCTKYTIHWKTFAVHQTVPIMYCTQQVIQRENFRNPLKNHKIFPLKSFAMYGTWMNKLIGRCIRQTNKQTDKIIVWVDTSLDALSFKNHFKFQWCKLSYCQVLPIKNCQDMKLRKIFDNRKLKAYGCCYVPCILTDNTALP